MRKNYLVSFAVMLATSSFTALYAQTLTPTLKNRKTIPAGIFAKDVAPSAVKQTRKQFNPVLGPARYQQRMAKKVAKASVQANIPALTNDPNSPVLYGYNKHNSQAYGLNSSYPAGIYYFPASAPVQFTTVTTSAALPSDPNFAFYANGKYYMGVMHPYTDNDYNPHANTTMYVFDANTWQQVGDSISMPGFYPQQCATYDKTTGKAYMELWNDEPWDWANNAPMPPTHVLVSMDPTTLKVDTLCKTDSFYIWMAAAPDGTLYGASMNTSKLVKIDKTTGDASDVGVSNVNFENGDDPADAYFDGDSLYVVGLHNDKTYLYCGNVKTAQFNTLAQFPNNERIKGLYTEPVADKAPGVPRNIVATYSVDSASTAVTQPTKITLTFNAPNATADGTAFSTTLHAVLKDNGTTIAEQDVESGAAATLSADINDGENAFEFYVTNADGKSQSRRFTYYVGSDVPAQPDSVSLSVDASTGKAHISWRKPKGTVHNGYVDDNAISYQVLRSPDSVVVATNVNDTLYNDVLPGNRAHYSYTVTPMADGKAGLSATTNTVAYGTYYVVPFTEGFTDATDGGLWKIIDANGDGLTWGQYQNGLDFGMVISTSWSAQNDYLISPEIRNLTTDKQYRLSFTSQHGSFNTPVEVGAYLISDLNDVNTWKLKLDEFCTEEDSTVHSATFSVPANGNYYLAIQAYCSNYTPTDFSVTNISVKPDASVEAPDTVSNARLVAADKGELASTLTFTAPSKTINGKSLSSLSKIEIFRGESTTPEKTIENPVPGKEYSYSTTHTASGEVVYNVRAYSSLMGAEKRLSSYVGIDIPDTIQNVKASMPRNGVGRITWDKASVKGLHGGYVDPSTVTYRIQRYNADMYEWDDIATGITATSYEDTQVTIPDGSQQAYVQYSVYPSSATGEGHGVIARTLVGTPYAQPYKESFAQAGLSSTPWVTHAGIGSTSWNAIGAGTAAVDPFDNDGGELQFANAGTTPQSCYLQSPRVDLKANSRSALSFYMYHGAEADEGDAYVTLYASVDDADTVNLGTFQYNNGNTGWQRHTIDLQQFAGNGNITFQVYAYTADGSAAIYLDRFEIDAYADNDLMIQSYNIPARMSIGTPSAVTVKVLNAGSKAASNYSVEVYKNGQKVASADGVALNPSETHDYSFSVNSPLTEAGDTASYYAKVVYAADTKLSNNATDTVRVYLNGPKYPKAADLKATGKDNEVKLTWSAPESMDMTDAVTDGFDSYQEFIIDSIGDWTTYDADKKVPMYFDGPEIPHVFEPQAWQVWNRDDAGFSKFNVLQPHSGKQLLAAFSASDGQSASMPNDNWLISPMVAGGSDVDFWTKEAQTKYGPETFEVLSSSAEMPSDTTKMADFLKTFTLVGNGTVNYTNWQENGFTLPDDARYFAIRHTTQDNGLVLLLDDVTYTPLFGGTTELHFKGYNIYRNGELIASNVTSTDYTDKVAANGDYVYQVSVVYTEGESQLTKGATVTLTNGISQVVSGSKGAFNVYTVNGALVRRNATSLNGLAKGVYVVNNQKVTVK